MNRILAAIVALVVVVTPITAAPPSAAATGDGLLLRVKGGADYLAMPFDNANSCHTQVGVVDYVWGDTSPGGDCPSDYFTTYTSGFVTAPVSGTIEFCVISDDGSKLVIGSTTISDQLAVAHGANQCTDEGYHAPVSMTAGESLPVTLFQVEESGGAALRLLWMLPSGGSYVVIPLSSLSTTDPTPAVDDSDDEVTIRVRGTGNVAACTVSVSARRLEPNTTYTIERPSLVTSIEFVTDSRGSARVRGTDIVWYDAADDYAYHRAGGAAGSWTPGSVTIRGSCTPSTVLGPITPDVQAPQVLGPVIRPTSPSVPEATTGPGTAFVASFTHRSQRRG